MLWPLFLALLAPLAATAALNAATFRRLPAATGPAPPISVLVPARDEAARLGPLLASFEALPGDLELVVYDDASTDGTGALVEAARARDPRIRLVRGEGPPPGWGGKVHALHRLSEEARPGAGLLLFADADVVLLPGGLARAAAALEAGGLDVLSLYPDQAMETIGERLAVPLMVLYFYLLAPQWLAARGAKVPVAPLNGQFMLWRRDRLAAIGGWAAIRGAWLDDMAMGRRVAAMGFRARYRAGRGVVRCRMYTGFADAWRGFVKHGYDALGLPPAGYLAVQAWLFAALVLPWLVAPISPPPPPVAAAWLALTLGPRVVASLQTGHGWLSAALHPVTMGLAVANALVSFARRREATWKGRIRTREP